MVNIEYMAVSYALVGILLLGYIGVQHHRVNHLWTLVQEEISSENDMNDDKMNGESD